eukprot:gene2216-biopygen2188
MSDMCTSATTKPAVWNALAISKWPLTPCSLRIATRGAPADTGIGFGIENGRSQWSPGSSSSKMAAYSCSAHSALSLRLCILYDTSAHTLCNSARVRLITSVPFTDTVNTCSLVTPPNVTTASCGRPAVVSVSRTAASFALDTCRTTPSSSLKSSARTEASVCTLMEAPWRPAKHISATDTIQPPSLLSWYARTRFWSRSVVVAAAKARMWSVDPMHGASLPIVEYVCASTDPPNRLLFSPPSCTSSSTVSSPVRFRSGVHVFRTSVTGANPVMTTLSGAVTFFCVPFSSLHFFSVICGF